jgi:hypothetical protein
MGSWVGELVRPARQAVLILGLSGGLHLLPLLPLSMRVSVCVVFLCDVVLFWHRMPVPCVCFGTCLLFAGRGSAVQALSTCCG